MADGVAANDDLSERLRQNYLTRAADSSDTAGAKLHGLPRRDAATIHADAASKKVRKVSDH